MHDWETHFPSRRVTQTLTAIAAVSIMALFGLSRHRGIAADERAAIGRSVEVAALTVSERWGGAIRDLAFDEADVNASEIRLRGQVDGLSNVMGTEAGEVALDPETFDDIDDYHGLVLQDTVEVAGGEVRFEVSFSVRYGRSGTFEFSRNPTTAKVATVVVREISDGRGGRSPVRVETPIRMTPTKQSLHS